MKDIRIEIYGENVVLMIEKFIETKDIEYITSMYQDTEAEEKILSFMNDGVNIKSIKDFNRIYPMYDKNHKSVYFRYWPTTQELSKKIKDLSEIERETLIDMFEIFKNNNI